MKQIYCKSEELHQVLAEMKVHQRKNMQLCVDKILATLNTTSPAEMQWKAARMAIQLIEGNKQPP